MKLKLFVLRNSLVVPCSEFPLGIVQQQAEKIAQSVTRIFKAVFPNSTNNYDTLFGGTDMHLMDEVAFITATRFTRKKVVTVTSDMIDFTKP